MSDDLAPLLESTITPNALFVNVDFLELVEHYNGDEAKVFEVLGKLKDLLV